MVATDVRAFARANLPPAPARVLEVGAGEGELARALAAGGYDVLAIDPEPAAEGIRRVALHELDEPRGSFAAAIAVLSLHHVEPLARSCGRLADLLAPGAPLVVDEFDVAAFDSRAAAWWIEQRAALGEVESASPEELVEEHLAHCHTLVRIVDALAPGFEVGQPVRGPYLYRWDLSEALRPAEEELIARGRLPAVGARLVARRRPAT